MPGQLFGNVEKRRCKNNPLCSLQLKVFATSSKGPNEGLHHLLLGSYSSITPRNIVPSKKCGSRRYGWRLSSEIQFKSKLHQTRVSGKGCDSAKSRTVKV